MSFSYRKMSSPDRSGKELGLQMFICGKIRKVTLRQLDGNRISGPVQPGIALEIDQGGEDVDSCSDTLNSIRSAQLRTLSVFWQ
jgi:hypothetical protein